jgi:Fur family ferric uptake transcriptional regulator
MKNDEITAILKNHALRITDCRIDTFGIFLQYPGAHTFREIEEELPQHDRVTVYRTLQRFIEQGILHSIPDDSGSARYGLCHDTCAPGNHRHNHVHFKCVRCGTIECISDHPVPKIEIPGYKISEVNLIMNGLCKKCNKSADRIATPKV